MNAVSAECEVMIEDLELSIELVYDAALGTPKSLRFILRLAR